MYHICFSIQFECNFSLISMIEIDDDDDDDDESDATTW